jgi:hypothetical protein
VSTKIKNLFDPDYSELDDAQEELTNYFNAVGNDRPSLVQSAEHFRHYYGVEIYNPTQFNKLKTYKDCHDMGKVIQGIASYHILENPNYQMLLNYLPPETIDEE